MTGRVLPRRARPFSWLVAAVCVGACGGSASEQSGGDANPVVLVGAPGLELPGLDELPEAQRAAFEDGMIDTAEYSAAFDRFQACANVAGENVKLDRRDPVSGYIEYGVNTENGGDPEDPTTINGRCNAEEWFWTELAWQLSDPTFLEQGRRDEIDRYLNETLPCLRENGVDAPAAYDGVPTPEFIELGDEWLRLYQAGKCSDAPDPAGDVAPTETLDITLTDDGDATLSQLVGEAEVVVHGRVASVVSLGRPAAAQDPAASEYVGVTIEVDSVLAGEADEPIRLAWDAFATDVNGERVATNVINGLRPPELGYEMLLFLAAPDSTFVDFVGGFPTYVPVRLDGVAYLDDGVVVSVERGSAAGEEMLGKSVAEITESITQ